MLHEIKPNNYFQLTGLSIITENKNNYHLAFYTSSTLINSGAQWVFNQSKYFAHNGSSVKNGTWYAERIKSISETPFQM